MKAGDEIIIDECDKSNVRAVGIVGKVMSVHESIFHVSFDMCSKQLFHMNNDYNSLKYKIYNRNSNLKYLLSI